MTTTLAVNVAILLLICIYLGGQASSDLKEVQLKILNDSVCSKQWGRIYGNGTARICVGEQPNRNITTHVRTCLFNNIL